MIYITAQPDRIKFYWQLLVQLTNFKEKGIDLSNVHVLVGVEEAVPSKEMLSLKETGAQIFFYPYAKDYRYLSSVRPHILKQHYAAMPELKNSYQFYLDCDVIFNRLPDYSKMPFNGNWYVSDTRSYIGANYIMANGKTIFQDMCNIVGIEQQAVIDREEMSGGCQYILTDVDADYWEKVEKDAIQLFTSFPNFWNPEIKKHDGPNREKYESLGENPVQIWCADMWSVLWNAWLRGKDTIIHEELNFSWANGSMKDYLERPIFHLAGLTDDQQKNENAPHFDKRIYDRSSPVGHDFSHINPSSATFPFVQIIKQL